MDTIGADTAKLAGLLVDLLQKYRAEQLTLDQIQWFVGLSKAQRDMLTGADLVVLKTPELANRCLRYRGTISVPEHTAQFNPNDFFKNRTSGLCMNGRFRKQILSAAGQVNALPETTLAVYDLAKPANDAEIRAELPSNHVFGATEACVYLAHLLRRQNGEEGGLITNGYANIFYVSAGAPTAGVFAVMVYWYADVREWFVNATSLDAIRWYAGSSVFSCNC